MVHALGLHRAWRTILSDRGVAFAMTPHRVPCEIDAAHQQHVSRMTTDNRTKVVWLAIVAVCSFMLGVLAGLALFISELGNLGG
jgi:hypothetical protein